MKSVAVFQSEYLRLILSAERNIWRAVSSGAVEEASRGGVDREFVFAQDSSSSEAPLLCHKAVKNIMRLSIISIISDREWLSNGPPSLHVLSGCVLGVSRNSAIPWDACHHKIHAFFCRYKSLECTFIHWRNWLKSCLSLKGRALLQSALRGLC